MEWRAAVRRLLLRRVQVLSNEVLDAIHMSGAGRPVQRRTSMSIDGGAEPVLVFSQEGQVAGRRGVEHVGVLGCRLLTDHFKAALFVFGRAVVLYEALSAERVEAVRSAVCYESLCYKIAAFLCAEERCGSRSLLLSSLLAC